jgi:hypothetical protein
MSENPYATPAPYGGDAAASAETLKIPKDRCLDIWCYGRSYAVCSYPDDSWCVWQLAARSARTTSKMIALALHNYHDVYAAFPPAYTVDENGQRLHSWRTLILPWLEHRRSLSKRSICRSPGITPRMPRRSKRLRIFIVVQVLSCRKTPPPIWPLSERTPVFIRGVDLSSTCHNWGLS